MTPRPNPLAGTRGPPCHRHVAKSRYTSAKSILRGQAFGFFFLLGLMLTAEFLHLPNRVFGDSTEAMWPRIVVRGSALLSIWLIVHLTTSRLLKRLHELETYLRICSWCRKVDDRGEWRTMEGYFDARFQTSTSHGICPVCARQERAKFLPFAQAKAGANPRS
jgi:hypothetical protein